MTSRRHAMTAGLALGLGLLGQGAAAAETWTVAVVPQFPSTEIHASWTPALERLSAQSGHVFRLLPCASIPHFEPTCERTHSNAYRHVKTGDAAAAGGVRQPLKSEDEAVQRGLRVIFETPPNAPHPLALIQIAVPMAADYRRDHAPLERLRLEKFVVEPKS